MKKFSSLLVVLLFGLGPLRVIAQMPDTLTIEDKVDISYKAKLLVQEYQSLLNVLANRNLTQSQSKILISNSFSPSGNQIFYDSLVVIEDDVDPLHTQVGAIPPDKLVSRYLNGLFFLYEKSDENTILFSNLQTSPVQEGEYTFVQVIYDSEFLGKHEEVDLPYNKTKRIAEVRANWEEGDWKTTISSVIYWDSTQVFQDTSYLLLADNIMSQYEYTQQELDSLGLIKDENGRVVSLEQYRIEKLTESLEETARKRAEQMFEENERNYSIAFQRGKDLLYQGKLDAAKRAFEVSQKYGEYRVEPLIMMDSISEIQRNQDQVAKMELDNMLNRGLKYRRIKSYDQALDWYKQALERNTAMDSIRENIQELEQQKIYLNRVSVNLKNEEYKDAIKDLGKAIEDRPMMADLYKMRGDAYVATGKSKRAFEDYKTAILRYPKYREVYIKRAELYLKENNLNQVVADYGIALTLDEEDVPLLKKRAEYNIRLNNLKDAIEDYSRAIKYASEDTHLYMERGKLFKRVKDYASAYKDFSQASSLTEEDPETWFYKGLASVGLRDPGGAAIAFDKAKERKLSPAQQQIIPKIAKTFYTSGRRLMSSKDFETAVDSLSGSIILDASNPDPWYYRGVCYIELQNTLAAIKDFNQVVELRPQNAMAFLQRGKAYLLNKQFENAAINFSTAGNIDLKLIEAHLLAAESYREMERYSEALSAYQKALAQDKDNPQIYFEMGNMWVIQENYPQALTSFKEAIKKKKDYAEALYNRGLIYLKLLDSKSALDDFSAALKARPNLVEAYYERGRIKHFTEGKLEEAIADFSTALIHRPNYFPALLERAYAYYDAGKYSLSLMDLELAIQLDSSILNDPNVHYKLGWAHLHSNSVSSARKHLLEAKNLSTGDESGILLGMGYCDVKEGAWDSGLSFLEEAFQSGKFGKKEILKNPLSELLKRNKEFKALTKKYLK